MPSLTTAMEEDWSLLAKGESVFSNDYPEGILVAIGKIAGLGDEKDLITKVVTNVTYSLMNTLQGDIQELWSRVADDIQRANDKSKSMHTEFFHAAKFVILTVTLLSMPVDHEHLFLYKDQDLVNQWEACANVLRDSAKLLASDGQLIRSHVSNIPLEKVKNDLEAELQQRGGNKHKGFSDSKRSMKKAKTFVGKLNGKHDVLAWSQLLLLGHPGYSSSNVCLGRKLCKLDDCKKSTEILKGKCKEYEAALASINSFEDLRHQESKFPDVLKAVYWGRYFCEVFQLKQYIEKGGKHYIATMNDPSRPFHSRMLEYQIVMPEAAKAESDKVSEYLKSLEK